MKLHRRRCLQLAGAAVGASLTPRVALALDYPTRPVRLVVGFTAGSTGDVFARLMGEWLSQRLGQSIVVDNRPGAGGNIGTAEVVRAAPDGYTLLAVATPNAINATLYEKLEFNFIRDIAPVASICQSPLVMAVLPSFPARSVPEFIAYAKANPGKVSYASAGIGTPLHIAGEMFRMAAGIEMVHVPYRGGPQAQTDLLGGQVQVMFDPLPEAIKFVRSGNLRALGVTTAKRSEALPDTPAIGEFLPGYAASAWYGMGAPRGTPAEIIDRLNGAINAGLADPTIKARLADFGAAALVGSPVDVATFIADETDKWGKVIRFAGVKAE